MPVLNGFWDVLTFFFWMSVFAGALFAVLLVVVDLFRDKALSGWWKALWLVFLIFAPFLTVLVYLVVRGRGIRGRVARPGAAGSDGGLRSADQVYAPGAGAGVAR
jgi:predicted permease